MSKKVIEKKSKLELEYSLRSSPQILYQYISSPSGLQSWFADHVDVQGGASFKFSWDDGTEYNAELTKNIPGKLVKFDLIGSPGDYLEFKIAQDEITGDIELIITEMVYPDEAEMSASIWDAAVEQLCSVIGA